ncbi:MAG: glycosyltransferase family 39 protein [Chloroflexi bacterium]|nr:glycosyltransferase family 39 protein [Chloroflexota bacterium]
MNISSTRERESHRILSHWLWVLVFLLTAAALSFYQADMFPPSVDEFATMYSAGWLGGEEMTLSEILQSLVRTNIANLPGYNLLLSAWGGLIAYDIAVARILGVFLYLLILAQVYRLARDFIAPVAGLFALIIVMSNAFFNFYIADARPYTLFILLSGITIWLYLRIITRSACPTATDCAALGTAVFALVMTHLFSATLLFALGLYHLLFAPKNRRWLRVGLAISIGVLLCVPMIALVLSRYSTALRHLGNLPLNSIEAISLWLRLMLNNQPLPLLLVTAAGLYVGIRRGPFQAKPFLILSALFLISLALASDIALLVRPYTMRHQLDGWVLLILVATAGHYRLYRWKPFLALLLVIWVVTGLVFQRSTNWWHHINIRAVVFTQPPIQALSRLAIEEAPAPNLIGFPYGGFTSFTLNYISDTPGFIPISQSQHYFSQYGMEIDATDDKGELIDLVGWIALQSPSIWFFHEKSASAEQMSAAATIMRDFDYQSCGELQIGLDTIVNQYMWNLLDCQPPLSPKAYQTELIEYEFFRAGLNSDATAVVFIGKWAPRRDFDSQDYNMSYQLISEDWRNVAQLDLPLLAEDELRQYAIDVSQVPPATYRLMLILYSASTGDRLAWDGNSGYVPEMLPLGEITIGGA